MMARYMVHMEFEAASDAEARAKADAIIFSTLDTLPYGYVSDADDWSELVTEKCRCGAPAEDGLRNGTGTRVCLKHEDYRTPIKEA